MLLLLFDNPFLKLANLLKNEIKSKSEVEEIPKAHSLVRKSSSFLNLNLLLTFYFQGIANLLKARQGRNAKRGFETMSVW